MTDILERLRYWGTSFSLAMAAAAEIEKLRAALIEINDLNAKRIGYSKKIERVIWEALGEKE